MLTLRRRHPTELFAAATVDRAAIVKSVKGDGALAQVCSQWHVSTSSGAAISANMIESAEEL